MQQKLISEIKPYSRNAKKHDKKQITQVAASIKEFGFNQPLVIDKNNVIIVGHGRLEAAKLLGLKEVPVIIADITDEQANAYRLSDNKLNESDWDMGLVIEELKGLSSPMLDLTGFSRDLILEAAEKDDLVPELPEEPIAKLGDIYQLGEHRVMCGDATKVDRSAAYKARSLAVNLLEERGAAEVKVYLAYAIGFDTPVQATAIIDGEEEELSIGTKLECKPRNIIKDLNLKAPIFERTAEWGHYGNNMSWDNVV